MSVTNVPSSVVTVDQASGSAQPLVGQHAIRTAPARYFTGEKYAFNYDTCARHPCFIESADDRGIQIAGESWATAQRGFNDQSWRAISHYENIKMFLGDRCRRLPAEGGAQSSCLAKMKQLNTLDPNEDYLFNRDLRGTRAPAQKPLEILYERCGRLWRDHKPASRSENSQSRSTGVPVSEMRDTEEGKCKRTVRELMRQLGNMEVKVVNTPPRYLQEPPGYMPDYSDNKQA